MKRPTPPKKHTTKAQGARAKTSGPKKAASSRAEKRAQQHRRATAEGRRGPPKGLVRRVLYWSVVVGLWLGAGLIGMGVLFAYDLPDTRGLTSVARSPSVTLLAMDGREIATRGDLYGLPVRVEDLPIHVEQAVLATEDRRFYHHFGFDPIGFTRAMFTNVRAGSLVQGGSTITQQLAKNVFLTADRTFTRKGKELLLAFWLEYRFSKKQILSLYLNRVYLGSGTYGIEAASQKYFGKEPQDLTLQEGAMIAGLLKAPSRYAPTNDLKRSQARAAQVIDNMVDAGFITEEEATAAKKTPARHTRIANLPPSRYYLDWVLDRLTDYIGHAVDDLVVETTLDLDLQSTSARTLKHWVDGEGKRLKAGQGAMVVMDHDGAVRALVGGTSYAKSQYNRATQAERQPGSAFKPFVYLAAMEYGLRPSTVRTDSPVSFGGWSPKNYDGKYRGPITLETALAKSINTVAVKISEESGRQNVIDAAHRAGINKDLPPTPSVALGTGEVTLMELTGAYIPFATEGKAAFLHGIERVITREGEVLYERRGSGPGRITSSRDARRVASMLRTVVEDGTGRRARLKDNRPAWGKTGTSQDWRDAWFIGFTQQYVAGVWIGNDDSSPMKRVTGGGLPALVWRDTMNVAHAKIPVKAVRRSQDNEGGIWDYIFDGDDSGSRDSGDTRQRAPKPGAGTPPPKAPPPPKDDMLDDIFDSIFGI